MSVQPRFYVVLEGAGTDKGGNFEGMRVKLSYHDRKEFDELVKREPLVDIIVYAGPDEAKAVALSKSSGRARANALAKMIEKEPKSKQYRFIQMYDGALLDGTTLEFLARLVELGFDIERDFKVIFE